MRGRDPQHSPLGLDPGGPRAEGVNGACRRGRQPHGTCPDMSAQVTTETLLSIPPACVSVVV